MRNALIVIKDFEMESSLLVKTLRFSPEKLLVLMVTLPEKMLMRSLSKLTILLNKILFMAMQKKLN